jgi:hypothetical protein
MAEKKNVVKISSLFSKHLEKLMQGFSDKSFGLLLENPTLSEYWIFVCFGSLNSSKTFKALLKNTP